MPRLHPWTLSQLAPKIRCFGYGRGGVATGIVHLGVGAFHRAHQAVFIDECLENGEHEWGIFGANLHSSATHDALAPQDWLYTVAEREGEDENLRVIGAFTGLFAPKAGERRDLTPLITRMAAPATRIVSLTVTEKGYCHAPDSGELDEDHPDIVHDLAHPGAPRTAIGLLTLALAWRREAGIAPFTLLSCDNLPANGKTVKRVLDRFAQVRDPELGRWVADRLVCPSSMVDRIVPATSEEDKTRIAAGLGLEDGAPVVSEPFRQWVLEDDFPTGRPDLGAVGVELVRDVAPFETMKLRLLNGAHSTLAYLGYLAGFETVAAAMADPDFARLVRRMMDDDIAPSLTMPPGSDLESYKSALIARFANPALRHRTWQIAMDGSQKLPQRLLGTLRDRLRIGAPIARLAIAIAGWMRYVSGNDEQGRPIDLRDPMAARLTAIAREAGPDAARLASGLLAIREIFGEDLAAHPGFVAEVTAALAGLFSDGARAIVARASTKA